MNSTQPVTTGSPDTWGDDINNKHDNAIRISFQNVNGLMTGKTKKEQLLKPDQVRLYMKRQKIDIHMMAEINVKWHLVPKNQTIEEHSCGWFEDQKISTAYNLHDKICHRHQPGGVMIIAKNKYS